MSFINYLSREINCKIVYYGPGLCGKTTNLQYIYKKTNQDAKGKMISLATETERTLPALERNLVHLLGRDDRAARVGGRAGSS